MTIYLSDTVYCYVNLHQYNAIIHSKAVKYKQENTEENFCYLSFVRLMLL